MKTRFCLIAAAVALAVAGCGGEVGPSDEGSWVGEIVEDGDTTTVRNLSGSVWGGTTTLVPEATIGVAEGADEYMLGQVTSIAANGREILLYDRQASQVRAYDYDGRHLRDIGGGGQGPGEYDFGWYVGYGPGGRIYVPDFGGSRMVVFSVAGEPLTTWSFDAASCCILPMKISRGGTIYLESTENRTWDSRSIVAYSPDGEQDRVIDPPEHDLPEYSVEVDGRRGQVMYAPRVVLTVGPGDEVIAGPSHEYAFNVTRTDGSVLRVERYYEPVPVNPEEHEWYSRLIEHSWREYDPDFSFARDQLPDVKPAFHQIYTAQDGRYWVLRQGPGRRLATCDPDADLDQSDWIAINCWADTNLMDVFDTDGRYLGDVEIPEDILLWFAAPWIDASTFIATTEDEAGTIRVQRYVVTPPQEATNSEV